MAGRGLNKVQIIGNLGKDPELKYTPGGKAFVRFSVAVGRVGRGPEGENRDETEWFQVVAWDKLAETCNQFLHKGSKVYLEGRLQTRTWKDNNGQDQKMVEIVANEMLMLDSRREEAEERPSAGVPRRGWQPAGGNGAAVADDEDVPF